MKSSTLFLAIAAALAAAADSFIKSAHECGDETVNDSVAQPAVTHETIGEAELDSNGLPWDERINASTKGVNADGSWKKRRGVDDAVVDAVTAELRALYPAAQAPLAAVSPPVVATPTIAAPVALAAPVAIAVPVPEVTGYTQLCDFLAKNSGDETALTDDWMTSFFAVNNTTLAALAADPDRAGRLLGSLRDTLKASNIAEVK